jgi:hypothetical protein
MPNISVTSVGLHVRLPGPWLVLSLDRDSYAGTCLSGQYLDKYECLQNVSGFGIWMAGHTGVDC